jgi:hypothetical protein
MSLYPAVAAVLDANADANPSDTRRYWADSPFLPRWRNRPIWCACCYARRYPSLASCVARARMPIAARVMSI